MHVENLLSQSPSRYLDVDQHQRALHAEIAAGERGDTVIYSEFAPVYTAGSRTDDADIPDPDVPVVRIDRGGSVTYHGPGQLVAYPLVKVHGRQDVVAYVRALEAAVMALAAEYGVETRRVEGRTGVWLPEDPSGAPDRKLCAIGVRFAKRTTMHGLALNVSTDLDDFDRIVPCGLRDAGVVSLRDLGVAASLDEVADRLHPHLERELARFRTPADAVTGA
ncbi:lipoyl(octanoyl) transferase LipB [Gulosibacter sp. 10]|uniref:lipoyl(octanoyl) transferase LipB n=1 Tax=Gulosibacter sp. 10 TaxID=1255570 RepID=UPI00097F6172|nr:lipoyl(octanoyl) transferase LipB [Gulosibacter sp. 10]SJM48806.1 Octanoate-[acyl-carrier-protein]-protein-N-octan oyltransferase [Gulosibacter sp. 10]